MTTHFQASFKDNMSQCPICVDEFDGTQSLHCCKQIICIPCLLRLKKPECPFCRTQFNFDDPTKWELPIDLLRDVFPQRPQIDVSFVPRFRVLELSPPRREEVSMDVALVMRHLEMTREDASSILQENRGSLLRTLMRMEPSRRP